MSADDTTTRDSSTAAPAGAGEEEETAVDTECPSACMSGEWIEKDALCYPAGSAKLCGYPECFGDVRDAGLEDEYAVAEELDTVVVSSAKNGSRLHKPAHAERDRQKDYEAIAKANGSPGSPLLAEARPVPGSTHE